MTNTDMGPVTELTPQQCWELLRQQQIGRLATYVNETMSVVPVNYVVDAGSLMFRSAEGDKLFALTVNASVALEIDGWDDSTGWSVLVSGKAVRVTDSAEVASADRLPLSPWVPTVKLHYVRIVPIHISGRNYRFGPEPEPDYVLD